MIEITPNNLKPAATITWPAGTASLEASIDLKLADEHGNMPEIASRDERWSELRLPEEGGRYRFAGLPSGRYSLSLMPIRLGTLVPVLVAEITIGEGEAKKLRLRRPLFRSKNSPKACCRSMLTPPMACHCQRRGSRWRESKAG